ncbi:PIN domain protein [Streptomyces sp. NBRC 110611]|nr:PIN domain protein [Streptomyces sp. NBRC 110611]
MGGLKGRQTGEVGGCRGPVGGAAGELDLEVGAGGDGLREPGAIPPPQVVAVLLGEEVRTLAGAGVCRDLCGGRSHGGVEDGVVSRGGLCSCGGRSHTGDVVLGVLGS